MPEKSLDQLIATLKSEAIHSAEKASKKIVEDAHAKAERILKNAEDERARIIADAKKEAEALRNKGEGALRQAARDLHLSVRNDLVKLFESVLEKEIQKEFKPDLIKSAVVKVIENVGGDVELRLPETFKTDLADYVQKQVQSSGQIVSMTSDHSALNTLSITRKDQGWSYEISPAEVAGLLQNHLTGNWMDILDHKAET